MQAIHKRKMVTEPEIIPVDSIPDRATSWSLWTRQTIAIMGLEIKKNFAHAAASLILVILAAPLALRFPRGGVGLVLAVSL